MGLGEKSPERQPEIIGTGSSQESKNKSWFVGVGGIQYKWWTEMIIFSFLVIGGQSVGTLLGRVYYDKGGKSNWLATLVQVAGFPALIPFQFFFPSASTPASDDRSRRFLVALTFFYVGVGIFLAVDCMLYSIGLQYLPVTTYTLICATQLGFNALFSFFLNSQKFTPYIVNSLILLTFSSTLLVFQPDDGGSTASAAVSKRKYAIGFICTVAASAGYAIMLSLTQLAFQKLIKRETIRAIIDMTIYQSLVATSVIIIGLFASGDWRRLSAEMEGYKLGKVSYLMNLIWTSISWQIFGVGSVGLIFKISSLFSNVISILGLPAAPVLAVIFLGERLTGLKAVSMLLAMWGFVSYIYQHYLDDLAAKRRERVEESGSGEVDVVALVDERGKGGGSTAAEIS